MRKQRRALTGAGNWLLRMVHMLPAAQGEDREGKSFFSTLTFKVAAMEEFPLAIDGVMRGPDGRRRRCAWAAAGKTVARSSRRSI